MKRPWPPVARSSSPHGTPIAPSSALAPRSTLLRPRAQAPTTRVISRRCLTSTSTPCTARYTSGSRRSPRRLCACHSLPPPSLPRPPSPSRDPQPPPVTPLSPPAPQRGLRLLWWAADATARRLPPPAPHPVREDQPGSPGRQAVHSSMQAAGGLGAAYQLGAGLGRAETAEQPPREPWLPSTRAMVCCHLGSLDSRQKLQLDSRIYLLMRKTS